LSSKRLSFREWSSDDAPLAISLWSDPLVTAYIGGPFSPEQVRQRLKRKSICAPAQACSIGRCFLPPAAPSSGAAAFARIVPRSRCSSLASIFCRSTGVTASLPKPHTRSSITLSAPSALRASSQVHHPSNTASERVLRRLGFRYTHHEHYEPTGLMHPSYMLRPCEYLAPESSA